MLVNDKAAAARLNSPLNLINKLSSHKSSGRSAAMGLFGVGRKKEIEITIKQEESKQEQAKSFNPFDKPAVLSLPEPKTENPKLGEVLEDGEAKLRLGIAHDRSIELLSNAVSLLSAKLDDVRADKLPSVIIAASKTIEGIRRERNEVAKTSKDREVHYHFYTPEQRKVSDYEIIDVGDKPIVVEQLTR